tara:strand:- start:4861 stop:5778 length:918 start_codon:yes stop_codon:yes gene_type:complete
MAEDNPQYDISGLPETVINFGARSPFQANGALQGIFNTSIMEPIPQYIRAQGEKVDQHGNAWMVWGRDRNASRTSGEGGQGSTQASSIDIVIGRGGASPRSTDYLDPNFRTDATRIYMSQKSTNVDDYFGLPEGSQGSLPGRSALVLKSDTTRLIGREGIKLVTRTEPQNSKGASASINGIELIAGNDDSDLQSMVKGENLVEALQELEKRISELSAIVLNNLKNQLQFNLKIASHTHTGAGPTGPIQTFPSISLGVAGVEASMDNASGMMDNYKNRINTNILWNNKYLNSASNKYICSKLNKVN